MKVNKYEAKVIFEAEIQPGDGYCYLVIYGRHINGYFCALPRMDTACEMAEPNDVYYNAGRLHDAGLSMSKSKMIAEAIREICAEMGVE